MKHRLLLVVCCALCVLTVLMSCALVYAGVKQSENRKLFLNDLYHRLRVLNDELLALDTDDAATYARVAEQLRALDLLCDKQRQFTDGAFYYENPGRFALLADTVASADSAALQASVDAALHALGSADGKSENETLRYGQISEIVSDLLAD